MISMKRGGVVCMFLLFMCCLQGRAQRTEPASFSMPHGESVLYDLYFKWGLIMTRAGEASFAYDAEHAYSGAVSRYNLYFKTTKFFDGFFKMRDTLTSYYDNDNMLIFSSKRTDEGNYYLIDELTFNYGAEKTTIHSLRYSPSRLKIDTTLTTVDVVTDMLSVGHYMRGVDRNKLKYDDLFPLMVAIGRDLVKIQFIYQNQAIIEHGNAKFNTRYFKIDIMDEEAFESTKTSAEVWIGDDDNFLPIKLRSKLKIGYAEVYFKNASGLAHPLNCRIEIKK